MTPYISIVIPYKNRLRNLRLALSALAEQTMPRPDFEIVLGAMEHEPDLTRTCQEFSDRLDIVVVSCAHTWQVSQARNMALQIARGHVVVFLDVDMVVPPHFLENVWERHFSDDQTGCVVGQMLDYDNNTNDVVTVEPQPFEHYRELLERLEQDGPGKVDLRLQTEHVIPWAFAWTALIALPRSAVVDHLLYFDTKFHGYGVEDLEWAYRVAQCGISIQVAEDVFGIHLPHPRNVAANRDTEAANYRYFLTKWPAIDVELAVALGDFEANAAMRDLRDQLARTHPPGTSPAVARGLHGGTETLVIGAGLTSAGALALPAGFAFDAQVEPQVLALVGLALPFSAGAVERCLIATPVTGLSPQYQSAIAKEAARVSVHRPQHLEIAAEAAQKGQ